MKTSHAACRIGIGLLGLLAWASTPAEAHRLVHGFHCPLGQYWRPSLGICQSAPYNGHSDRVARRLDPPWAGAPRSAPPSVSTHTQVLSRSRTVSGTGVVVRYVVQTSVVERYRKPSAGISGLTRVSGGAGY